MRWAYGALLVALWTGNAHAQETTFENHGSAYIAYAGPYASSPASAFGHLFLVMQRDSMEAIPLWDVVSFSAETNGAGPLKYFSVGILGGFQGRYQLMAFHEKSREYESLDDRDLWLTKIDLTSHQRGLLERELAATAGRWYPYTFFERNCAYYIQQLLARVMENIPAPDGPTSPTGVYRMVLKSGDAGPSYFRPGASTRLQELRARASPSTTARLRTRGWKTVAADTSWLSGLPQSDRRFVQEYFWWKALSSADQLSEGTSEGLALLRVLNADDGGGLGTEPPNQQPGLSISEPRFHSYTRATLSYMKEGAEPSRVLMRFRPAMHDDADSWAAHRPLNSLEFLSAEMSVGTADHQADARMEKITVFSQRSLQPSDFVTERSSWMLELGAERGGLFGKSMHWAARGGTGKTYRLGDAHYMYALLTGAFVVEGSKLALAPGFDIGYVAMPSTSWRFGVSVRREHDMLRWARQYQLLDAWFRHDLTTGWGVRGMARSGSRGDSFAVGIDWYR